MYAVSWRHGKSSPWTLLTDPLKSEQDAREKINEHGKYDMAKREYRIIPLGDPASWHDPVAEQEAATAQTKMEGI